MFRNEFINQYKLFFFLSWIIPYIVFPAWALPVSVTARALVYLGLVMYFSVSAVIFNRWFNALTIDKPVVLKTSGGMTHINSNLMFIVVCSIAVIIHIRYLSLPILIMGDEALHLTNGLWIYEYIDYDWHNFFRVLFWVLVAAVVVVSTLRRANNSPLKRVTNKLSGGNYLKYLLFFLCFIVLIVYFFLLKDITYSLTLIRYPPIGKILYFLIYSAFGIDHIYPRIVQLIFYLLCATYLYRTIILFYDKQTALMGATIYLFLPISFAYAYLGELESGVIFFIAAISFYFLRFIRSGDDRDLLLSVFLIGVGFLYKDPAFLVFPVCFIFLSYQLLKKNDQFTLIHLKVLLLSLVPVIPWMIITKLFSWRNYTFVLSHLTSLDRINDYFSIIATNVSETIFILFIIAFVFFMLKRNILTGFFGLLFIGYCFFIVSDMGAISPRFSMVFYPTISIYVAVFVVFLMDKIKLKKAFALFFTVLIVYLVFISSLLPVNNRFLQIENKKIHYFDSEKAMKWVKENVKDGEKILTIRIMTAEFYKIKFGIERNKVVDLWYEIEEVSTPDKLKDFTTKNEISYIMFPYNKYISKMIGFDIINYLQTDPNKEFSGLVKFKRDDNFINIYNIK